MVVALVVAVAMNLFAYWNSDKMVLSMYGAREVDERSAPELVSLVRQLAGAAGIPMPRVGSLLLLILGPLAAGLVQMAISRTREYEADREGAEISKRPLALASALEKIAGKAEQIPNMPAEHNPASAHLFIVNPLSGARMDNLFSTHPNVENRVARLEEIAREMGTTAAPSAAPSSEQFSGPWTSSPSAARRGPWG